MLFVLVGFASFGGKGGQWSNFSSIIENGHRILAVDPMHSEEPDEYISDITGVPVRRMVDMEIWPFCVNIISAEIQTIGQFLIEEEMVILSCSGNIEIDSSNDIMKSMRICNPNAYAFGLGCFANPPNLHKLEDILDRIKMGHLIKLETLQRFAKLIQNNGCAFYRAERDKKDYDWFTFYLKILMLENKKEAAEEYQQLCKQFEYNPNDYISLETISGLIMNELENLGLASLWCRRD